MLSRVRPLITVKLMDASRLLSFHLITKFADPLLHNDASKEGRQEDSAAYEIPCSTTEGVIRDVMTHDNC